MKTIESVLMNERQLLEDMVKRAERRMQTAPKGHIVVRRWKGIVEYYYSEHYSEHYTEQGTTPMTRGRYMKKHEIGVVKRIIQRDYDCHMIRLAKERIKDIDKFLQKYKRTSLKLLYKQMNPARRALLSDVEISDEEFVEQWQNVEYEGKPFLDSMPEIVTERGERVRSKSEKIIADKLYMLGIPYRYEYPLVLVGNRTVYPDFTILKMPQREEVYMEHFGLMDDENYVENVLLKLQTYEKSGIYPGVQLFATYETKKMPLNIKALDEKIRILFCADC